jgi:hypothetical protein
MEAKPTKTPIKLSKTYKKTEGNQEKLKKYLLKKQKGDKTV